MTVIGAKQGYLFTSTKLPHANVKRLHLFSRWSFSFSTMVVGQKVKVDLGDNVVGLGKTSRANLDKCRDNFENHLQWKKCRSKGRLGRDLGR